MNEWYVLYVLYGREREISGVIRKMGLRVVSPSRIMLEHSKGAWREVERPLLPGYVFLEISDLPRLYNAIMKIPGAMRFLGADGPESVPCEDMAYMLRLGRGGEAWGISSGQTADGTLLVTEGPLVGMEERIERIDARRHRAKVRFDVIGESRSVELALMLTNRE